ncbi:ABC transporter permease [Microbulbifer sediminum]|uniref:ABC transporter permease n=1 Tax=Microbulbifer sediminum TaxID=2904250 RepID=UPI001F3235CA|nr:FtsX-like permease family protein [Microbulbifer sediminum]
MLELKPMLSALWRNKISAMLIALQLALTLAIVSNASIIVQDRIEKMARPTGMPVEDLIAVTFQPIAQDYDMHGAVLADLDLLRSIPGVVDATHTNQIPVSGSGSASVFHNQPNQEIGGEVSNYYETGPHFIQTLGMNLVAGRNFTPADMQVVQPNEDSRTRVAIITRQMADALYPDGNALGKSFYNSNGTDPVEIVGIVERHLGAWVSWSKAGNVIFFPRLVETNFKRYMVRAEPGRRDEVLKAVEKQLAERDPQRVMHIETLAERLERSYMSDNVMVKVLSAVVTLLTFIVALGIVGLTVFWINQRRKQIGVRRALGATRLNISRYFLVENTLIAITGVALGMAGAQIANHFMVSSYSQPALSLPVLLVCALILVSVSLAAALVPALRAANISPATATRSV